MKLAAIQGPSQLNPVLPKPPVRPVYAGVSGMTNITPRSVTFGSQQGGNKNKSLAGYLLGKLSSYFANEQTKRLRALSIPYSFEVIQPSGIECGLKPEEAHLQIQNAKFIALGDLHGNSLKLVETLVTAGLVDVKPKVLQKYKVGILELTKLIYERYFDQTLDEDERNKSVYEFDTERAERFYQQYSKLSQFAKQFRWKDDSRQLLLMGDVIADRGHLDMLTLDLIDHLNQGNPNRIIHLISNHDTEAMLRLTDSHGGRIKEPKQYGSYLRSRVLANHIPYRQIKKRYQDYLRQSKWFVYHPQNQVLFTHGAVQQQHFDQLADYLSHHRYILSCDKEPEKRLSRLASEADKMQSEQVDSEFSSTPNLGDHWQEIAHPFNWGQFSKSDHSPNTLETPEQLPFVNNGVLHYVHAHHHDTAESPYLWHNQLNRTPTNLRVNSPNTANNADDDGWDPDDTVDMIPAQPAPEPPPAVPYHISCLDQSVRRSMLDHPQADDHSILFVEPDLTLST